MTSQAYFQDIRKHIKEEIVSANQSIWVAVAWFTDRYLFKWLCDKAEAGRDVQLIVMDDDITRNCSIDYTDLEACGGKLFLIHEGFGTLMHHKFCVIDEVTVITGSYNWSMKATTNHENITVTKSNPGFAYSFMDEFRRIKETYYGKDKVEVIDFGKIHKRLQIIQSLVQLEDFVDILPHIFKLNEYDLPEELREIIHELENARWNTAGNRIQTYLSRNLAITAYKDVKVESLKWQLSYIEVEIIALENEKSNIEKMIADFVHSYTLKFGDILSEILRLKKERLKDQGDEKHEEYQEAEKEYQEFYESFKEEKEKQLPYLNNEEKDELKKKYRKAAAMCHPDIVYSKYGEDSLEMQKAQELYIRLKEAYDGNDLNTVSKIVDNLEKGIFDFQTDGASKLTQGEQLEARLAYLKERLESLRKELATLRMDETYLQLIHITDMDTFFKEEEERYINELKSLKNE